MRRYVTHGIIWLFGDFRNGFRTREFKVPPCILLLLRAILFPDTGCEASETNSQMSKEAMLNSSPGCGVSGHGNKRSRGGSRLQQAERESPRDSSGG